MIGNKKFSISSLWEKCRSKQYKACLALIENLSYFPVKFQQNCLKQLRETIIFFILSLYSTIQNKHHCQHSEAQLWLLLSIHIVIGSERWGKTPPTQKSLSQVRSSVRSAKKSRWWFFSAVHFLIYKLFSLNQTTVIFIYKKHVRIAA